jgi:hypothetical protein
MRKAFDANVPKLRPRLKANGAAAAASLPAQAAPAPPLPDPLPRSAGAREEMEAWEPAPETTNATARTTPTETTTGTTTATTTGTTTTTATTPPTTTATATGTTRGRTPTPAREHGRRDALEAPAFEPAIRAGNISSPSPHARAGGEGRGEGAAPDVLSRKERLDKIKRKVADAARPQPRTEPVPADPARAAQSVLGLVQELEAELVRVREREEAMRADLEDARRELSRAAGDGRASAERLVAAEQELEEKRSVLAELLEEMQALEGERDDSVRRAQALSALDEERARLLEDLSRRAEDEARLRAEREAEVEKLSEELRHGSTEAARLRTAIGELARERDQLAGDLDRARRERDELSAAKGALEQVHAALAQARARLG